MPKSRQLVLAAPSDAAEPTLGTLAEMLRTLRRYNVAPDGSPEGTRIAHGPGFTVELPYVDDRDPVKQALITAFDEDSAWPVLFRLCNEAHWRLIDAESGMEFGG